MSQIYNDYSKARMGWFFGLTGWQLCVVAASTMPVWWAVNRQAWASAGLFGLVAAAVWVVTVVPVRGRSAIGWIAATTSFSVATLAGWTRFRSHASRGRAGDLAAADLPGSLAGVETHEGPPVGLSGARVAIIQNHATRTWAVTAAVVHPGIGMREGVVRDRMGKGLADLLDSAARTELVDELIFLVRTVPEDGAERDQWVARHRRQDGPAQVRAINEDLQRALDGGSVRTEGFVTVVVPEARIAKPARESGRGLGGRAAVLYALMAEVEAQLRGALGMVSVEWLTSQRLAVACRTGFAPGDRAGIVDALLAQGGGQEVNTDVPWAMAGPSGADPVARHYSHDAWNSVSSTIKLPPKGAVLGALAPILTPTQPGERRTVAVVYEVLSQSAAAKQASRAEWAADMGQGLREKAKVRQTTPLRDAAAQSRNLEVKHARGSAVIRSHAVATVTVPKTQRVAEAARGLDASIRRAGFAGLRLDLSQDVAFAASVVPLGVSLTRRSAQ